MAKCFLHIGMEKSGSTSIQQVIRKNAPLLESAGIIYPQSGAPRLNHNFLASSYLPEGSDRLVRGLPAHIRKGEEKQFLDAYRRNLMARIRQGGNVVISGEHLFRLRPDEIAMLKRDLAENGIDDLLVFGVLRAPVSFYLSFIQQEVKGSSKFSSPDDFFVDYAGRVAGWQQHFTCMFFDFNALSASREGIVRKFLQELSRFMDVDLSSVRGDIPVANDSLSPEEMQIVQDFRLKWYPELDGRLNRPTTRLIRALHKVRDSNWRKPILREEIAALIAKRHEDELATLSALTGVSLDASAARPDQSVKQPSLVKDVVANFDRTLYERLSLRVGSSRHVDLRTRLSYMVKRLGHRREA